MNEIELNQLSEIRSFRGFIPVILKIEKIVKHARTFDGFKKYDDFSHVVRCGLMKIIAEEWPKLRIKRGRPPKKIPIFDKNYQKEGRFE